MEYEGRGNKRFLFGIILIIVGVIWIMKRLGYIPEMWEDVLISWQMLLIVIGAVSLVGGNRTAGIIIMMIGGFFMIPELIEIPWELRRIAWPLLLVGIGVALLFRQRHKPTPLQPAENFKSLDFFDEFVVFGGREVVINSQNLIGGKTSALFGGTEYDMRHCQLSPNGAVVDCFCMFGGIGFKVPPDWTVKNEVTAVFGGFSDKRGSSINTNYDLSKTLIIKGFTAFGGIEVKNF